MYRDSSESNQLIHAFSLSTRSENPLYSVGSLPSLIVRAGEDAIRRFVEFFAATIRYRSTRDAYAQAIGQFFGWCENRGIQLVPTQPITVAAYIEHLSRLRSAPTVKQHLAAIRMCFDWLVTGHIVAVHPTCSAKGPPSAVKKGKTPVLTTAEARRLLDSINTSALIGLRDRALIGVMVYSFARVSAVVNMNVEDFIGRVGEPGFDFTRRTESATRCPCTTPQRSIWMPISAKHGSQMKRNQRCSARKTGRPAGFRPYRCLELMHFECSKGAQRLPGSAPTVSAATPSGMLVSPHIRRMVARWNMLRRSLHTRIHELRSCTIERQMRFRSMRLSAFLFRIRVNPVRLH